jgi:glycerol-3-phosphate acyltransferase PlsY
MTLWLCPLLAFLVGSIPFGLLIARSKGVDIRAHGSGNIGATNVLRTIGKKYGIACLVLDLLKGFVPTLLSISLVRFTGSDSPMVIPAVAAWGVELPADQQWLAQTIHVATGLAAILGHNYSPFAGFRGGKGIATTGGVLIALMPAAVVILLLVWVILFFTTRYVSVASMGAAIALPVLTIFGSWYHGKLADGTWNRPLLIFAVFAALLAVWRHRSNIRNLIAGTEHRFARKSRNPGAD